MAGLSGLLLAKLLGAGGTRKALPLAAKDPLFGAASDRLEGIGLEGLLDLINRGKASGDPSAITLQRLLDPSFNPELTPESFEALAAALNIDARQMPSDLTDIEGILRTLEDPSSTDEAFRMADLQRAALTEEPLRDFPIATDPETGEVVEWAGNPLRHMMYAEDYPVKAQTPEEAAEALAASGQEKYADDWLAPPTGQAGAKGSLTDVWNQLDDDPFFSLIKQKNPEILFRLFQNPKFAGMWDVKETGRRLKERVGADYETRAWEDLLEDQNLVPVEEDFVFKKGPSSPGRLQTYSTVDKKGTAVYYGEGTPVRVPIKEAGYRNVNAEYDESADQLRSDVLNDYLRGTGGGHVNKPALRALREQFSPRHVVRPYKTTKKGAPLEGLGLSLEEAVEASEDVYNIARTGFGWEDDTADWVDRQIREFIRDRYGREAAEQGKQFKFEAADTPIVAHIVEAANNAALARDTGAVIDDPGAWYNLGNVFHSFINVWGDHPMARELGQAKFLDFVNMVGATTSAQAPAQNFRSASWYNFALGTRRLVGAPLRRMEYPTFRSLDLNSNEMDVSDWPDALKGVPQTTYSKTVQLNLPNRLEWEAMEEVYPGALDRGKGWIAPGAEGKEGGKFVRHASDEGGMEMIRAPKGSFKRFQKVLRDKYRKQFPTQSAASIDARVRMFEPKSYINPYWGLPAKETMGMQPAVAMFDQKKASGMFKQRPFRLKASEVEEGDPRLEKLAEERSSITEQMEALESAGDTGGLEKLMKKLKGKTTVADPTEAYAYDEAGRPLYPVTRVESKGIERAEQRAIAEGETSPEGTAAALEELATVIRKAGGVTYDVVTKEKKIEGWAVAPFKSSEEGIPKEEFDGKVIHDYIVKWGDALDLPGVHYGVWYKEETGEFMQDISVLVDDEISAAAIGRAGDQDAIVSLHDDFREVFLKATETEEGLVKGIEETYDKAKLAKLKKADKEFSAGELKGLLREAEGRITGSLRKEGYSSLAEQRYAEDPLGQYGIQKAYMAPPYAAGAYYNTWQKVMEDPVKQAQFFRELFHAAYKHIEDKEYAAIEWPAYFRVNPLDAQKAGHFIGNLAGEELTVTLDKVMSNIMQMRGGKGKSVRLDAPEDGSYILYDEFVREIAKGYDMDPRDFQGMAWLGSSEKVGIPGVGSSAQRILQERFKLSAAVLNRFLPGDKAKVTPDMIRILWMKGAFPLLSLPVAMSLGIRGTEVGFDLEKEAS